QTQGQVAETDHRQSNRSAGGKLGIHQPGAARGLPWAARRLIAGTVARRRTQLSAFRQRARPDPVADPALGRLPPGAHGAVAEPDWWSGRRGTTGELEGDRRAAAPRRSWAGRRHVLDLCAGAGTPGSSSPASSAIERTPGPGVGG